MIKGFIRKIHNTIGAGRSWLIHHRRLLKLANYRMRRTTRRLLRTLLQFMRLKRALGWQKAYHIRFRLQRFIALHGTITVFLSVIVGIGVSAFCIPFLQNTLESLLGTETRLQGLRSLFLTIGGALLGATAIVSSLVLFAMQVNVERMPHGLFQRLGSDRRLLSAFAGAVLLAVFIAILSLLPDSSQIGVASFSALWATSLILLLFLYGYRRALILINPSRQLCMTIVNTRRDLQAWVRRAKRAEPILAPPVSPHSGRKGSFIQEHDMSRVAYFKVNRHWADGAKQSVQHAISFAHRFAKQGDHEVSGAAMNAIIAINSAYVEAKGRTFFADQLMVENPLTTDGFINDTLENLRQTARIGVSRGDEQQIEQTLKAFAALVHLYATIDYCSPRAAKTHAHLAAEYLIGEVERIVPHHMPDVLMEGTRLMGQCAEQLLVTEGPSGIQMLVQKLGIIGSCGTLKEDYYPVTMTCVEQLARLSLKLLTVSSLKFGFEAKEIRDSMSLLARIFLSVPDKPLSSAHRLYLGPYYSATSSQALASRIAELVNIVAEAKADDQNAQRVIANIEKWADGLYQTEKEILLEAIKRRSQFSFDMIHWITSVTSILLAVSNALACNKDTQKKLRKHALWLVSALSFIPGDIETVKFVETYQFSETLYEAALDAHRRDCHDVAIEIAGLLVWWMFTGGQYQTGWATLEHSLYGAAVLAVLLEVNGAIPKLKSEIGRRLLAGGLPNQEVKDRAAREIRGRAAALHPEGHWSSSIEAGMARTDHAKLGPLLEELADLISPGTVGQAAT